MISNTIFIMYITLFTNNLKEFSLDSIYKDSFKKIEYINQQKKNHEPNLNAKVHINIHKKLNFSKKMELLNLSLVNKKNMSKYLINTKLLRWSNPITLKDFKVRIINDLIINIKDKQIMVYLQKIKSINNIKNKSFLYMIKMKILKYLIKKNDTYFIKLIANNYCNCSILRSDIKKEKYNSGVIYNIHKKFLRKEKSFNIKNNFTINIFETGSVIDFSWSRFGERVNDNKKK